MPLTERGSDPLPRGVLFALCIYHVRMYGVLFAMLSPEEAHEWMRGSMGFYHKRPSLSPPKYGWVKNKWLHDLGVHYVGGFGIDWELSKR